MKPFEEERKAAARNHWKHLTPFQRNTIKQYFLKFYNKFDCSDCPYKVANREHQKWFKAKDVSLCWICTAFDTLLPPSDEQRCPCLSIGPDKAYERLGNLLKKWKML